MTIEKIKNHKDFFNNYDKDCYVIFKLNSMESKSFFGRFNKNNKIITYYLGDENDYGNTIKRYNIKINDEDIIDIQIFETHKYDY